MSLTWIIITFMLLVGLVTSRRRHERFAFLAAFILLGLMVLVATLVILLTLVLAYAFSDSVPQLAMGSIFVLYGLLMIIAGIVLYFFLRLLHHWWKFSATTLTLIEYYIQWSLIYATIYQIVFDNLLKSLEIVKNVSQLVTISSNIILVAVLSAFIASWIAVILFKFNQEQI